MCRRDHKQSVKDQSDLSQATNFMQQWGNALHIKEREKNVANQKN